MSDLNQSTENQKRKSKRILIAEPDSDITVILYISFFVENFENRYYI
jgi:hypothetical protein